MYYSSFGILAFILHQIINRDVLKNGKNEPADSPHYRYRQFLISLMVFYLADLLWGFLVDSKIRALAYVDTVVFFMTMALSVVLWTRYVVAFLDKKGIKSTSFLAAGWGILGFVILGLVINFFDPFIFAFTEDALYIPQFGRYILLVAQVLLFVLISIYSLFVSLRSEGRESVHYMAVFVSGGVMAVFVVIQTFFPFAPFYTIGCFIANCLVHVYVEEDERDVQRKIIEDAEKQKSIYSQIASSLATDYDAIYYINIETGKFLEISASDSYRSLDVPSMGKDFYNETRENVIRYVHPDDRAFAESMYFKETMLKNLQGRRSYSYQYRIMAGDEVRYYRFTVMLSDDGDHFVVCDKDIQDTITAETENQRKSVTFSQIAESLASNYDVIYYVDMKSGEYAGFTSSNIYGGLKVDESGSDFFSDTKKNIAVVIHPKDRDRMFSVMDKDYLLTALDERKQFIVQYRLLIDGRTQHTRLSARRPSDPDHVIICIENIEEEIKREREHLRALNTEKELARRDELTGARNKTAFTELEQSIQDNIDNGMTYLPFAVAVCDVNDLKKINDTEGHKAGDDHLRASARMLFEIFDHSPVFRIGGDEFAIFLRGEDYTSRGKLMERLHTAVLSNRDRHDGPVIASGMSEYDPQGDTSFDEIFERADHMMYEDKRRLKSGDKV